MQAGPASRCPPAHSKRTGTVQGLRDPDAHVRWAACQALGQMCTDLGPDLQQAQHAAMLPGLMSVMDDFNAPRVQVDALTG
jgi:importin-5